MTARLTRQQLECVGEGYDPEGIFLTPVQLEVFCHLVFVNLDPERKT